MRIILFLLAVFGAWQTAAVAQTVISAEAGKPWLHQQSGISAPPAIEGMRRTKVTDHGADQHDVGIRYANDGNASFATLYVYRAGLVSPPIWADRAMAAMLAGRQLGTPRDGTLVGGMFTPPNASGENSGFIVTTAIEGADWKTNGLLLFAHNEWLIKLRMTSDQDQKTVQSMMLRFLKSLSFQSSSTAYPTATLPEACPDMLQPAKNAKLIQLDTMGSLAFGAVMVEALKKGLGIPQASPDLCRDASSTIEYGVYRLPSQKDGYLLTMGDSGKSVTVERFKPGRTGGLVSGSASYIAVTTDGVVQGSFPPFTKLPSPATVYALIGRIEPIVTNNLLSKDQKSITITVPGQP